MKLSEFLDKVVLDENAVEVGKISDMDIEPKQSLINSIIISIGDFGLKRKVFEVKTNELSEIGDYVILTIDKTEIESRIQAQKENNLEKTKETLKKVRLNIIEGETATKIKTLKTKRK